MRIAFMGTRDIAVPALHALVTADRPDWQVVGVVTQPDRPAGRSGRPTASPVKSIAQAAGIPVLQPESWRDDAALQALAETAPDVGVVASYAQLLPRRVLRLPAAGWLNIHPSLLPRHRGPSPVAASILAGDTVTGVTIIKLTLAMDAGPVVKQVVVPVKPDDTATTLTARLGDLGGQLLLTILDGWVAGHITAQPQDITAATYSRLLSRQDGLLDWTLPAGELERRVRAYDPWPGAFTFHRGRRLSILRVSALPTPANALPGTVLGTQAVAEQTALRIATGDRVLAVYRLQLEGRRALDAEEFVRGQGGIIGMRLGT
jgi:methionyl-tRNA formyltransferase